MNNKLSFVIVGIIIVIAGALFYVSQNPTESTSMQQSGEQKVSTTEAETNTTTESPVAEQSEHISSNPGTYTAYSEQAVLATTGTKLLFFHAPWCPQCRSVEASINKDGLPSGVTVFKLDYDSNQALRQKYDVLLQTTFVLIDDQGNKVKNYVAYDDPVFASVERALLQ